MSVAVMSEDIVDIIPSPGDNSSISSPVVSLNVSTVFLSVF